MSAFAAFAAVSARGRYRRSAEAWRAEYSHAETEVDRAILRSLHRAVVAKLVALDVIPTSKLILPLSCSALVTLFLFRGSYMLGSLVRSFPTSGVYLQPYEHVPSVFSTSWFAIPIILVHLVVMVGFYALNHLAVRRYLEEIDSRRSAELDYLDKMKQISGLPATTSNQKSKVKMGLRRNTIFVLFSCLIFVLSELFSPHTMAEGWTEIAGVAVMSVALVPLLEIIRNARFNSGDPQLRHAKGLVHPRFPSPPLEPSSPTPQGNDLANK